jgi:hypothetical protein
VTEDLHTVLGAAAGAPGDRPDLDGLWTTGRRRRRNGRLARGAVAVVALVGLAVGAVALVGGDDGVDVVAGPDDRPAAAPPAEPTDGEVTIELDAGPVVDGVPTPEPGAVMTLTYVGPPSGIGRNGIALWERWDGAAWITEHLLVVERAGEPGSGEVLGTDVTVDSGELRFGEEVDRYPTPEDLSSGWYRICVPMIGFSGQGPTTTVPGETLPPVTTGLSSETSTPTTTTTTRPGQAPGLGQEHRPCAQLRLPGDTVPTTAASDPTATTGPGDPTDAGGTPTTAESSGPDGPPPADTNDGEVRFAYAGHPPYAAGGSFVLQVLHGGGITLGFETTWEQWDGTDWVRTHLVDGVPYDGIEPGLQRYGGDAEPAFMTGALTSERDATNLVVTIPPLDELTSQWSRVCLDATPEELGRPCAQVAIDGAGGQPPTTHGDPTTWRVDGNEVTSASTSVTVLATRIACNDGVTGELLEPQVRYTMTAVVITVDAEPSPGMHTCPGNDVVPVTVELGSPIGDRTLVDGWCADPTSTTPCEGDGDVRWTP